jgi:probable HAF family extracellular repeat protein
VTGFAHVPSEDAHAFRYDGSITDLGTLGGKVSLGNAINVADHVVGQSSLPGDAVSHAFLHDGHTMIDLGTLGGTSSARGVNAADTVVGESLDAQGVSRAFVIYQGDIFDLNTVTSGLNGAVLSTATAINDSGQIVAMSCTAPLVCQQAFRLDPVGAVKMSAIEYHHAEWDHYFMTAIPDEIAKLDSGFFHGWTRTGESINVYVGDQVNTSPVCRFFSTAFDPRSSHFYTPFQDECVLLQRGATWQFEARVFNITVPDGAGNCPANTLPVYRLYNQGMGCGAEPPLYDEPRHANEHDRAGLDPRRPRAERSGDVRAALGRAGTGAGASPVAFSRRSGGRGHADDPRPYLDREQAGLDRGIARGERRQLVERHALLRDHHAAAVVVHEGTAEQSLPVSSIVP